MQGNPGKQNKILCSDDKVLHSFHRVFNIQLFFFHTRRGKKSSFSPFHKPFTLHSQASGKPRSRTIPHIFRLFHIFPSPYYEYYNKFNIDLEVLSLFYGRKNLKT